MSAVAEREPQAPARGGAAAARAGRLLAQPRVQTALALLAFVAYAVALTWPAAADLGSNIYGAPGDLTGSMANLRELVEGRHNPFTGGTLEDFNAPEGQPIRWQVNLTYWPALVLLYALAVPFGAVAATSLYAIGGYVASALAMFLLVRRLTGHAGVALIIGWAFAFYPFATLKGAGHIAFVHGWAFVLVAWRMWELHERPSVRNGLWAAAAAVLAIAWSPYFILIGGVLFATLVAVEAGWALVRRDLRPRLPGLAVAAGLTGVYVALLAAVTLVRADSGSVLRTHGIEALYVYGARLHEYLVPTHANILVGDQTGPWLTERLHGSNGTETSLYLGLTLLALAAVGVVSALRERRVNAGRAWAAAVFVVVGLVAFAFSAPPRVDLGPVTVPTPSEAVFQLTSTWRVYSRFVMVVMLAVCVLAAFGAVRLLRGRRDPAAAVLVVVLGAIVFLDLYTPGPGDTTLRTPAVIDALREQPDGIVAQYPLRPEGMGDYQELFLQDAHGKRMLNGYDGLPQEARALALARLADDATPGALRTVGVRYVVLPDNARAEVGFRPGQPTDPDQLRPIARGRYGLTRATVYEVVAAPRPVAFSPEGFAEPETAGGIVARWMTADEGEVVVQAPCDACRGRLTMRLLGLVPQRVTVSSGGRTVYEGDVRADRELPVSIPLRFSRRAELTIRAEPGAVQIPGPDPRDVSVRVIDLRYEGR